jgi:hypothetical protein
MKMISVSCGVSRQVITVTLSRLTQTVCALRSVHFTHDAIAGAFPCPDWVELDVRKRITLE